MIWNIQQVPKAEALASCVWSEIHMACSGVPGGIGPDEQLELARSVAFEAMREFEGRMVPCGYLALLAARALWAVGEVKAARRLIDIKSGESRFSRSCAEAVLQGDISLQAWWLLCSLRAVRPLSFLGAGRGMTWVLDVSRAFFSERACLELMVFQLMSAVLDEIAPLWDRSKGHGALALRNVDTTASLLLRNGKKGRKTGALTGEIRRTCSMKLQSLSVLRGWQTRPHLFNLDW